MPWPVAHGPDIAHYQNITGEPVDPAWRLFSHKCSEGAFSGDATFPSRWKWMRTQGFEYRGAYHWLRSDSPVKPQAENVIKRLDAQGGLWRGEFVQSDWETTPRITVNTAEDEREFCDRLEQHYGRACTITYSSDWIPDSANDSDTIGEFYEWLALTQGNAPLWYANYNSDPLNKFGGQQECARYGADVWQFTSSYRHPSIVSLSGGGFDMNHVIQWETLNRIAGYSSSPLPVPGPFPPPLQERPEEMFLCYVVYNADRSAYCWMKVGAETDQIRQVTDGQQWQALFNSVSCIKEPDGTGEREPENINAFGTMLRTLIPVGELNTNSRQVLGDANAGWWDTERARLAGGMTTVTIPPITIPPQQPPAGHWESTFIPG